MGGEQEAECNEEQHSNIAVKEEDSSSGEEEQQEEAIHCQQQEAICHQQQEAPWHDPGWDDTSDSNNEPSSGDSSS